MLLKLRTKSQIETRLTEPLLCLHIADVTLYSPAFAKYFLLAVRLSVFTLIFKQLFVLKVSKKCPEILLCCQQATLMLLQLFLCHSEGFKPVEVLVALTGILTDKRNFSVFDELP